MSRFHPLADRRAQTVKRQDRQFWPSDLMSYAELAGELSGLLSSMKLAGEDDPSLSALEISRRIEPIGDDGEPEIRAETAQDRIAYVQWLKEFRKFRPEIRESCSQSFVHDATIGLLRTCLAAGRDVSADDLRAIVAHLENIPVREFQVLRPVEGLHLPGKDPLELGQVMILRIPDHRDIITEGYPNVRPGNDLVGEEGVIGRAIVDARDAERAREFSDELFQRLEDFLRFYTVEALDTKDVGIFDARSASDREAMAISRDRVMKFFHRGGPYSPVEISAQDPESWKGLAGLLPLLETGDLSGMEERLLAALEWISRARRSTHRGATLAQLMFAIEALLNQESRKPISPSTISRIVENAALLLEEEAERRLELDARLRELYGKRSALVHGGSTQASLDEIEDLDTIAQRLVVRVASDEGLTELNDLGKLYRRLKEERYS